METNQKIEKFKNEIECLIEDIALYLGQNKSSANTFILQFNNSIYELLDAVFILLDEKYIESAGTVISTLWERNLMLEFIYLDFEARMSHYKNHTKLKQGPWRILEMVKEVTKAENYPDLIDEIKIQLYYSQYTFLCAIKHGNPFTFNYLNRSENHSVIGLKLFDESKDEDLIIYLKLLALNIAYEYLSNYYFFSMNEQKMELINHMRAVFGTFRNGLDLNVPTITQAEAREYDEKIWEYFENL